MGGRGGCAGGLTVVPQASAPRNPPTSIAVTTTETRRSDLKSSDSISWAMGRFRTPSWYPNCGEGTSQGAALLGRGAAGPGSGTRRCGVSSSGTVMREIRGVQTRMSPGGSPGTPRARRTTPGSGRPSASFWAALSGSPLVRPRVVIYESWGSLQTYGIAVESAEWRGIWGRAASRGQEDSPCCTHVSASLDQAVNMSILFSHLSAPHGAADGNLKALPPSPFDPGPGPPPRPARHPLTQLPRSSSARACPPPPLAQGTSASPVLPHGLERTHSPLTCPRATLPSKLCKRARLSSWAT